MTLRFDIIRKIAFFLLLYCPVCLPVTLNAQTTSITVVSDTTDNDEGQVFTEENDSLAANSNIITLDPDMDAPSWWKFFLGDGSIWELARSIFTDGSMLLIPLIILFCIILFPVLLIVLLIVFLMRDNKRNSRQSYYARQDTTHVSNPVQHYQDLEKEKDRLVINIAIALGVTVLCIAYSWRFGTVLAVIYLCVQGGKYYNLKRAEKRNNDDNIF